MGERHVISLSTAWLPPDPAAGRRAWIRRFGMPAGIEPDDQVWLVVESSVGCGLALAGETLPTVVPGSRWRQDVSGLLRARNELLLAPLSDIAATPPRAAHGRVPLPAVLGRVRLEIESGRRDPA